jgi:hypothetical protein
VFIAGTVLKTENIRGSRPATADAAARSWDFDQVTIWDGNEAHACLVGRDFGPDTPGKGEDLVVEVAVNPRRNTRSGAWELSVTLLRRLSVDDLLNFVPDSGETPALRAAG